MQGLALGVGMARVRRISTFEEMVELASALPRRGGGALTLAIVSYRFLHAHVTTPFSKVTDLDQVGGNLKSSMFRGQRRLKKHAGV